MAKVIQLHLWMRDKRKRWTEPEVINKWGKPQPGKRIVLDIQTESVMAMKLAVAKELQRWMDKIEYYYVVAVVEKNDGTIGYRVVVKTTTIVL